MGKGNNCWEFENCGRQPGGENAGELGVCPAAIDKDSDGFNSGKNGGRLCWAISGTFCKGEKQGTFAKKRLTCVGCDFFNLVQKEEGRGFVLLKANQDYNLWLKGAEKA